MRDKMNLLLNMNQQTRWTSTFHLPNRLKINKTPVCARQKIAMANSEKYKYNSKAPNLAKALVA